MCLYFSPDSYPFWHGTNLEYHVLQGHSGVLTPDIGVLEYGEACNIFVGME
jgi:hypothetical protein